MGPKKWKTVWRSKRQSSSQRRAVAARLNHMAADCQDVQSPGKQVCRNMSNPMVDAVLKLKKVAGHMVSQEAVRLKFVWREEGFPDESVHRQRLGRVLADEQIYQRRVGDAGGPLTQDLVSDPTCYGACSAEATCESMVEGAMRGFGIQTMLRELGVQCGSR